MSRIVFSLLVFAVLFSACNKKTKTPEVEKIEVKLLRFEKDLFNSDISHLKDSIPFFQKKYGEFFEMFNHKIINIGSASNPAYPDLLRGFVTDYDMNLVNEAIDSIYSEFTPFHNEISTVFSYFKHYFPNYPIPVVVTYMSGFNQSMVGSDTVLGIGLDRYLGANSNFYVRLGYAQYMKQNMYPSKIPSDCAKAWVMTQFSMDTEGANLLDHILYQGKILYVNKLLLPEVQDSLITGFSENQIKWCHENEKSMWAYFIENKLLFKTDYSTVFKFIGEAPFTKDFGRNSPGKAATWIGYKIVSKYMEKHPDLALADLMTLKDSQKILREAKYKP